MKRTNFILFALFLLLPLGELWAQEQMPYRPAATFKGDTLRYLEYNYSKRREQYIGKTVEVVLKELEYPIIYVSGDYRDGVPSRLVGLTLGIRQVGKERSIELRDYYIFIGFANPPDGDAYWEATGANNHAFSQKTYDFIKDLEVSYILSNPHILKDPELVEIRRQAIERGKGRTFVEEDGKVREYKIK